jgi:Tol biopolymer transport system component
VLLAALGSVEAQVVRQFTDGKNDGLGGFRLDDSGTTLMTSLDSDPLGANPEHFTQVVAWTLPADAASAVTSLAWAEYTSAPAVTDDGLQIAFASRADPLGQNPDHSAELFLVGADGSNLQQLTDDTSLGGGGIGSPAISGSGNRILFGGDIDPGGGNPDHTWQLFVLETDSSTITQLTHLESGVEIHGFSISDDGERIVFSSNGDLLPPANSDGTLEIFRVDADGSQLVQLTSSPTDDAREPTISGNGIIVAFESGEEISIMTWFGTGLTLLASGRRPSISDNGRWIYYDSDGQIFSVERTVGTPNQLTSTQAPIHNRDPQVSGDNTVVAFRTSGGEHAGGDNPDGGDELMVMDADGSDLRQIGANKAYRHFHEPDIAAAGDRLAFVTIDDTQPDQMIDVFRVQADGSDLTRWTQAGTGQAFHPTLTADGQTLVFMSWGDLTDEGCFNSNIYRIQADGSGLAKINDPCGVFDHPTVAANGSVVTYQSGPSLLASPGTGGAGLEVIDEGDNALRKNPRVSADGAWVTWHSPTDFDGLNPDRFVQVFRARTDGSVLQRVTLDTQQSSWRPDISGDGQRVVFVSTADPLGTNGDHNDELFLYDAGNGTTLQLTVTTGSSSADPLISEDGNWVYFASDAPFFGSEPGNYYRLNVESGIVERAGGPCNVRSWALGDNAFHTLDGNGSRGAFVSTCDIYGTNRDSSSEVFFVDRDIPARIRPGQESPTVVHWDFEPGAVRFDVIRGDAANLRFVGAEVDLGPVACLENDSTDADTIGFEDLVELGTGQAFFYLYRGTQGVLDGPGSWGLGSAGTERLGGPGECPP